MERLIASLHGIGPDDVPALRARLHNLRRLNFPDGVAAGSGRHFAYAAPDVIAVAVAFELVEAFVPPAAAAAIVRTGWPEIALTAAQGWEGWGGLDGPASITVHPRALRQPAGSNDALPPHHVEVQAIAGTPDHRRTIALDVGWVSRRISNELRQSDPRSHALMAAGIEQMAQRFGSGRALDRDAGDPTRLGGDGPYWARASALIAAAGHPIAQDDVRALTWFLDYAVRPAPVDRWKTRVEVEQGMDVGFGAALAWVCSGSGLSPSRTALQADELQRVGRALRAAFGTRERLMGRLAEIADKASASSTRDAKPAGEA